MDNEDYTGQYEIQKPTVNTLLVAILVVLLIFAIVWILDATGIITNCGVCDRKIFNASSHEIYGKDVCGACYDKYFKGLFDLLNEVKQQKK